MPRKNRFDSDRNLSPLAFFSRRQKCDGIERANSEWSGARRDESLCGSTPNVSRSAQLLQQKGPHFKISPLFLPIGDDGDAAPGAAPRLLWFWRRPYNIPPNPI